MLKKCLTFFSLIAVLATPFVISSPAFADSSSYVESSCNYFLGMTSWNCGVDIHDGESLKTGIWRIAVNIAADISILAAYLVIGYVIYGGYLYTFSSGDPGKVAAAKKTLFNAFLGLAIVMSAYLIMSTIRFALLGADGNLGNCINVNDTTGDITSGCIDAGKVFNNAVQWAIGIAGLVSAIFVVYGGISYVTSTGDPGKLAKAKQMIIYALIGLAIVGLTEAITAFVSNMIRNADNAAGETGYTNSIIISKGNL